MPVEINPGTSGARFDAMDASNFCRSMFHEGLVELAVVVGPFRAPVEISEEAQPTFFPGLICKNDLPNLELESSTRQKSFFFGNGSR